MNQRKQKIKGLLKLGVLILGVFLLFNVVNNFFDVSTILGEVTANFWGANHNGSNDFTYEDAKAIYDKTSSFNHIDIRVNGSFTTDGFTREIKLSNVKLKVMDGSKTILDTSFNNSTTYEWRKMNVKISKTAEVYLTFDIILDKEVVREDYTTTFAGEEDFVQAIINCDMHQGLDFKVNSTEIIQAALYNVTYQWTNLPSGLAELPEQALGYDSGDAHAVDTKWQKGSTITDEVSGKLYTFSGWTTWSNNSDSHTQQNNLTSTSLSITEDTIIYGTWEVSSLNLASSHITLNVSLKNNNTNIPEDLYFVITNPLGVEEKVLYSSFINGKYDFSVSLAGNYTITQYSNFIAGYNSSVNVTSNLQIAEQNNDSVVVSVNIPYQLPGDTNESRLLGTINYTNTYEKKYGNPVYNYPTLTVETLDAESKNTVSEVTYELESNAGVKATINANAAGTVNITNIKPATYTLTQQTTADNYHITATKYTIVVALNESEVVEKYRETDNCYYLVYNYSLSISPNEAYDSNSQTLTIYNERITGELTITSKFGSTSDINASNMPITSEINILIENKNNYSKKVTLNSANGWTVKVTNLELGTYTVQEVASAAKVAGHNLTVEYVGGQEITISSNSPQSSIEIINTYKKKYGKSVYNYPTLIVETLDAENKNAISEVTYELESSDGVKATFNSSSTGIVDITNIKPATYTLTQKKVADNYYLNDTKNTIVVALDESNVVEKFHPIEDYYYLTYNYNIVMNPSTNYDTTPAKFIVYNQRITGEVVIMSEFSSTSDINASNMPVTSEINVLIEDERNFSKIVTLNSSNDWTIKLTNLELGTYTVQEVVGAAKVAGYDLTVKYTGGDVSAEKTTIDIKPSSTKSYVDIVNTYKKKYGESIYNYPTLTLEALDADNQQAISRVAYKLIDTDSENVINAKTEIDGIAQFTNIKPGTYLLSETKQAKNYHHNNASYAVSVLLEGDKPIEKFDYQTENFYLVYNYYITIDQNKDFDSSTARLQVFNSKITGTVTVSAKIEHLSEINDTGFVAPVEIKLSLMGENNYYQDITLNNTNNWTAKLSELPLGSYELKGLDNNVPGYNLTVKFNGQNESNNSIKINITEKSYITALEMTNTYTQIIEEVKKPASISIQPTDDDGKIIVDTNFGLYDPNNEMIDEQKTDSTGTVTFTGIIEEGTYSLKLLDDPEKYNIKETEWSIKIALDDSKSSIEFNEETNSYQKVYALDVVIKSANYKEGVLTLAAENSPSGKKICTYILVVLFIIFILIILFINSRKEKEDEDSSTKRKNQHKVKNKNS